MTPFPSIFNDVIGPVMRGPSSSHCAAALRIGRLCRDLMDDAIEAVHVVYDHQSSLATTHRSQGSDMGLLGGLMGWDADDERLPAYLAHVRTAGIRVTMTVEDIGATHPNTYQITLQNDQEIRDLIAISAGGGMIEIVAIEGAKVSITGDSYETLVFGEDLAGAAEFMAGIEGYDALQIHQGKTSFLEIKSPRQLPETVYDRLRAMSGVDFVKHLDPVLPILRRKDLSVPFITVAEMLAANAVQGLDLWQLAMAYEAARGNTSEADVWEKMRRIAVIMQTAIAQGLAGTEYKDRILGNQSANYKQRMDRQELLGGDVLNHIILYVTAVMEVKSAMGVIVAAPTAGACGVLPGAILGVADVLRLSEDEVIKALLSAGMIGVFIAAHATFAAEVGGCQAECGSGSGMAAAALVSLAGGSLSQALNAASLALQNSLGMICDPVANRVEAPCLGKNAMAATNALACANMALAGYDPLIPLDEVIEAMDRVGKSMPASLRCTGLGGLSTTKTAQAIALKLDLTFSDNTQHSST